LGVSIFLMFFLVGLAVLACLGRCGAVAERAWLVCVCVCVCVQRCQASE
jgi:hypothetical protein